MAKGALQKYVKPINMIDSFQTTFPPETRVGIVMGLIHDYFRNQISNCHSYSVTAIKMILLTQICHFFNLTHNNFLYE
jgi:hypothetical protein